MYQEILNEAIIYLECATIVRGQLTQVRWHTQTRRMNRATDGGRKLNIPATALLTVQHVACCFALIRLDLL